MRPFYRMLMLALVMTAALPAHSQGDPCRGYQWDVSKERALFAASGKELVAGKDQASAAAIGPSALYVLGLAPANQVSFPVAPGKDPSSGSYAGIIALTVPSAGKYRVAVDLPLWIDVVGDAKLLAPLDYEGVHGCDAPRKIVEFDLAGSTRWLLQLSSSNSERVRLTVTPVR